MYPEPIIEEDMDIEDHQVGTDAVLRQLGIRKQKPIAESSRIALFFAKKILFCSFW